MSIKDSNEAKQAGEAVATSAEGTYNEIKAAWNADADYMNEWDALSESEKVEWAYKQGFSDGMKEAPTGEDWIRAIDEALVGAHLGVVNVGVISQIDNMTTGMTRKDGQVKQNPDTLKCQIKQSFELPEPVGKVMYEAKPYEQAWLSSEDAYTEDQMREAINKAFHDGLVAGGKP